jgi:hypothetical protein
MADQRSRGGKKEQTGKQGQGQRRQGSDIAAQAGGGTQRGRQGIQRDQKQPGGRRSGNE